MANNPPISHEPMEAHGVSEPTPHHPVPYILIFASLLVLTVVTVLAGMVHFDSNVVRVLIALAIACVKGTLVAMFFMHLKFEGKLIYLIAIVPLILTVILVAALIPDTRPGVLFSTPVSPPAEEVTSPERGL
jgi:cytochrome c oxidase subunit IV